jgi:hypothetical protein
MSRSDQSLAAQLQSAFHSAASGPARPKRRRKRPAPFSLRLSPEEQNDLKKLAQGEPLGTYIRYQLFGAQAVRRKYRRPTVDHQKLALVLAALGQSRLSQNINQLAKAANMGTLDCSPETEIELQTACAEIIALRQILIEALGLKSEG